MVCGPPVVSKCLGEAHRRLELFTLHYITLLFPHHILLVTRATDQQYGIRTKQKHFIFEDNSKLHGHTNEHGHIKRLTGAFFLADIQTMTSQVHRSWACIHVSTNFT